jgi:hypothetical protein
MAVIKENLIDCFKNVLRVYFTNLYFGFKVISLNYLETKFNSKPETKKYLTVMEKISV